jgi:hypothetical protein
LADLRFGVRSEDGLESSIWRLTTTDAGDVYVSVRSIMGEMKASLHQSGECQVSLTSQYAATRMDVENRHFDTWYRPKLTQELQGTVPLMITFPVSDLRTPTMQLPASKEVLWIPSPQGSEYVQILFLIALNGIPLAVDNSLPFMRAELNDGQELRLYSRAGVMTESQHSTIQQTRPLLEKELQVIIAKTQRTPGAPRAMAGSIGEGEIRILFDLALY